MTAGTQQRGSISAALPRHPERPAPARPSPTAPSRSLIEGRFYLGLIALVITLVVGWLTILAVVPMVAGWSSVVITSGSMTPSIEPGDVVAAAPSDGHGLGPGTVIVFEDPLRPGLVTHRISSVSDDGTYQTKGDANRVADSTPVAPEQVVGVAKILVPMAGLPALWARTGAWINFGVWVALMVVAMWSARFALAEKYNPWPRRSEITVPTASSQRDASPAVLKPLARGPDGG